MQRSGERIWRKGRKGHNKRTWLVKGRRREARKGRAGEERGMGIGAEVRDEEREGGGREEKKGKEWVIRVRLRGGGRDH